MFRINSLALVLSLASFIHNVGHAASDDLWSGKPKVIKKEGASRTYTAGMHNRFSGLSSKYQENGEFFYSNYTNSFGQKEALNTKQEMIFCNPGDMSFSDMIEDMQNGNGAANFVDSFDQNTKFAEDASTIGFAPEYFDSSVRGVLANNANANSKGRFCYDLTDRAGKVDFRTAGAENEVFCAPSSVSPLSFVDGVSGFSCKIKLDIPLKVGETRFMRQLQEVGEKTIASGFAGCYKNEVTGKSEFKLIENPATCTSKNRDQCNYSCDWAHKMVCDAKTMPRWGSGKCGGFPTLIFKGDSIYVDSSDQLSFDQSSGTLYSGGALLSCNIVGDTSQWVVLEQSCNANTNP